MSLKTQNLIKKIVLMIAIFSLFSVGFADSIESAADNDESGALILKPIFPTPYVIELPINNESNSIRAQNFAKGLYLILIQTSNDPEIVNLPAIQESLSKPEIYIKEFNYINKVLEDNKKALFLQIRFDAKSISRLLKRSSQTAWIKSKPQVLFWLGKEFGRNKVLVNENNNRALIDIVKEQSLALNVPAVFPVWDIQDIGAVKSYDICGYNLEAIRKASKRYGVDWSVIGCIKQPIIGGLWISQWFLLHLDKSEHFIFSGVNQESVISQAITVIGKNIGDISQPVIRKNSDIILRVSNVNGLEQYHEVVKYLRTFDKVITEVDLVNLNIEDVELRIKVIGGQQSLLDILSMQNRLVPDNIKKGAELPPGLDYRWVVVKHGNYQILITHHLKPL